MTDHRLDRRDLLKATGAGILAVGASGVAQATDGNDAGTEEATEIEDWHDLDSVRDGLSGDYALTTDLDEESDGYEIIAGPSANGGFGFQPIGDSDNEFLGTFDGQSNSIADLVVNRPAENGVGLFGQIGSDAILENTELVDIDITGDRDVGGIAGDNRGEISSLFVKGTIAASSDVGGIAGSSGLFDGVVTASSANVTVTTEGNAAGGLVGSNIGEISDSFAEGSITASGDGFDDKPTAGGIVGSNSGEVVNSHYNVDKVDINGENQLTIGGLFDQQYQDWLESGRELDINDYDSLQISAGQVEIADVEGIRDALGFIHDPEFDWRLTADINLTDEDVDLYLPYIIGDFNGNGHTVTVEINNPVASAVGFIGQAVENNITDICVTGDVVGTDNVGGLVGEQDDSFNNPSIINNADAELSVSGNSSVGGLVGDATGEIANSTTEVDVTGDSNIGGLVGNNTADIINSNADGQITGREGVGGLVGDNFGDISDSSATCEVIGTDDGFSQRDVGGLVGDNRGEITDSFATGSVSGVSRVGGLAGANSDLIINSYATGSVSGESIVGGLAGRSRNEFITVTNTHAIGPVSGDSIVGGIVGRLETPFGSDPDDVTILRDSYWNTETTGETDAVGEIDEGEGTVELRGEVEGLDTDQMQGAEAENNMSVLNFAETWQTVTDPDDYPILQWQGPNEGTVTGTVTDEDDSTLTDIEVVFLDTDSGTEIATTVTDEDGTYEVELAVGDYEAVVEELGFGPFEEPVTVEADEETVLDIELQSQDPGTVGGAVTDTDENPLNGVEVSAAFEGEDIETTTTDDTGAYELTLAPATYTVEAIADGFQRGTASVTVEEDDSVEQDFELAKGLPALPGQDDPPQDLNDNGLFEDVDGDGEFTIFDVQAFFTNFQSETVQSNPAAFNFTEEENPEEVTIFDVQALFKNLVAGS